MPLTYQRRGDHLYARVAGESYRKDGKVQKRGVMYLGRVIDKENNVFYNKDRGVFTYDPIAGEYGEADPSYQGTLKNDGRKKQKLILDFGDSYFLDSLINAIHYDEVIDSMEIKNTDSLKAMILYYVLSDKANSHAQTWIDGNFAKVLYPKADIHSQKISRLLDTLGKEETKQKYFHAHIKWLKEHVCDDNAYIFDSTGLPNAIRMNLTQVSNHNGQVSNEARMITAVQRDSGYPVLFRLVPGNIVDVSTLQTTILTLAQYDVRTDFSIIDAGYFSVENALSLYRAEIEFLGRLPETNKTLYMEVLKKGMRGLKEPANLVQFNDRYVYVKQVECKIDEYPAYAFLCYDVDASSDANHKAIKSAKKKKRKAEDMHQVFASSGLFVLISSLPFQPEEILEVYYNRQLVEQYFDLGKGLSRLIPLRVHTEQRVAGHVLLSQIAATINLYIQKKMGTSFENGVEMFMELRNQKCVVYTNRIITNEAQSGASKYYRKFKIPCPVSIDTSGENFKFEYDIIIDSLEDL